ncbi:hypothetical protein LOZ12_004268 [Ophidiomyces ophidiicola]|uniref:Uncharacterized protein n=1 Tax=Ophidiomyces ophidiicola TaxID=1387563 RepID=A0ACB8UU04_9EURO|nr:hypothetical protein LOZ62_004280 [Ophidiomyces ophidiicola]KAI1970363.1 hypothetical protein LOZ56_003743 [Ophidiomyces ophidiicola]KAI2004042.1 hypothetical protein LOZ50_004488 [Ophidiomyces ophidiicola]KAI2046941.1 hypothetical protein LOZ44_004303 [Ophidiomyces ophidiicola]KAI2064658.1 hypothetical protein LOZ40_004517 [Ophidiomyces ophidiicola]
MQGSYNINFPVVFCDPDGREMEKWIVRIPLIPRLAFPEEKMRGEIATMKYVSEKTKIPIAHLYGYSISSENVLGQPFMLLEFIEGQTLHSVLEFLEANEEKRKHHNRPLTISINDQEVGGLNVCQYLSKHQTFTSTVDYAYMLLNTIFNEFYHRRDSVYDEEDARCYIYSLYLAQGVIMEWIRPEFNHGPFILMHKDLRPCNIIVDDNLNIISVLDWEWSHTVPTQLFVPPSWLTRRTLLSITHPISMILYNHELYHFRTAVERREYADYNPSKSLTATLPLTKLWREFRQNHHLFLAFGLQSPGCFSSVFLNVVDTHYFGLNRKERMRDFFERVIRQPALSVVEQKLNEARLFQQECERLGIDVEPPIDLEAETMSIGNRTKQAMLPAENAIHFNTRPAEQLSVGRLQWPLISITVFASVFILMKYHWK